MVDLARPPARRVGLVLAVAALVAVLAMAAFPAFLALRSMGSKMFEPESFDFALLGSAIFAIAVGAQVVPFAQRRYVVLVAILSSGFLLLGFLAAFSFGLAALPAGAVFLLLLFRALRRESRNGTATRAALGGAAIGFALPLLYIALIVPATVECFANGAGGSSGRWHQSSQIVTSMGGGSATEPGVFTGTMTTSESVVTYRCEGGKLVEFERRAR